LASEQYCDLVRPPVQGAFRGITGTGLYWGKPADSVARPSYDSTELCLK
jgi:hypothetical protein